MLPRLSLLLSPVPTYWITCALRTPIYTAFLDVGDTAYNQVERIELPLAFTCMIGA